MMNKADFYRQANFYKEIREWLLPLGYIEVYNTLDKLEFHFGKDGIRVICTYGEGFYLSTHVFGDDTHTLTLRTSKYDIAYKQDLLDELVAYIKHNVEKLKA